jgi:uncharacterized protein YceH (UPF0502 family)
MLETQVHNINLQWESEREGKDKIIKELRARVDELEAALEAAQARIEDLEG